MTLGDFELVVTNVTILSLEIESTATINSPVASFSLSCHTNVTNGLNRLSSAIEVTVRSKFYFLLFLFISLVIALFKREKRE